MSATQHSDAAILGSTALGLLLGPAADVVAGVPAVIAGPVVTLLAGVILKIVDHWIRRREQRDATAAAAVIAAASAPTGPPRVLVVDDEDSSHLVAAHAAEIAGATLVHASTARAALVALSRDRGVRLVLLDLRLPDSGPARAFAQEIRDAAPAGARVIVLSGVDSAEETARLIGAECLTKPISSDTLAAAMRTALAA